jgi:hypothetical protein
MKKYPRLVFLFFTTIFHVFIFHLVFAGDPEIWEKHLGPDLSYIMKYEPEIPRVTHILKFKASSPHFRLQPEITATTLFPENIPPCQDLSKPTNKASSKKESLSQLVQRTGAIGGITGDFFDMTTGVPVGTMVRNGELITPPCHKPRGVFGWGSRSFATNILQWSGSIRWKDQPPIPVKGFNRHCPENALAIYTPTAGYPPIPSPSVCALLKLKKHTNQVWSPHHRCKAKVVHIFRNPIAAPVPQGHVILAARGSATKELEKLRVGQKIRLKTKIEGFDWSEIKHAIGGGPYLLREGKVIVDSQEQQFTPKTFTTKRYARTTIGRTKDQWICMVVIDGPSSFSSPSNNGFATYSAGATLKETAEILLSLGCEEALNLDGGGSATMVLYNNRMNRTSDLKERPLGNALLLFGEIPKPQSLRNPVSIQGPAKIKVGGKATFSLVRSNNKTVPVHKILWSSNGSSWIDQGGNFHAIRRGETTLQAWYKGNLFSFKVLVENNQLAKTK